MPPAALMAWLDKYAEKMATLIGERRGVIDRFDGSGLMALFGVPVRRDRAAEIAQDAQDAAASAIAMGTALARLNADLQARGLPALRLRIGIATGLLVASVYRLDGVAAATPHDAKQRSER